MRRILTLNNISVAGLRRLPRSDYEVASEITSPDAVLLRSFNMHDMEIPPCLAAVGRAGAGVNNIPLERMSRAGIPVFNSPGANANAVKELVIASILMALRELPGAIRYVEGLSGDDAEIARQVEAGKNQFVGSELPGKTLGVIGLGAIGVEVANAAQALGMQVIGCDPQLTVRRAWQLSAAVEQAAGIDDLFRRADVVSVHVPLMDATRGIVSSERLALLPSGAVIVNLARGGVVDESAVIETLDSGKLRAYIADFPTARLIGHSRVIALPHLGASTREAEDNCAVMVVDNLREYLENGNIQYSVNFPESVLPRDGSWRISIANANVPNMVGQISTVLAKANLNIADLLNKSLGELAYTLVDLDGEIADSTLEQIRAIDGVLRVRSLGPADAG